MSRLGRGFPARSQYRRNEAQPLETPFIDRINIGSTAPAGSGGPGSTVVLTTTAPVAAGASVVLGIGFTTNDRPATVSVSGGGLTWTVDSQGEHSTSLVFTAIAVAYAPSGLASGTNITVTFSLPAGASAAERFVAGSSFFGLKSTSAFDVANEVFAGGVSTTTWSLGLTTTVAQDLVYTLVRYGSTTRTSTPTAPAVELFEGPSTSFATATAAFSIAESAGAKTNAGTFNLSVTSGYNARSVAYKTGVAAATVTGSATLSGTGTASATGTRIRLGAATLTGNGTLAATGRRTVYGAVNLTTGGGSTVLDDFNRSDSSTLGSNWQVVSTLAGGTRVTISGNAAAPSSSGIHAEAWLGSTYGANQEITVTIAATAASSDSVWLLMQMPDPAMGSFTGYLFQLVLGFDHLEWNLYRGVTGSYSNLYAESSGGTYAAGDTVTLSKVGDTFKVKRNGSQIGTTAVDSSPLNASGTYVGFGFNSATTDKIDDFTVGGGGTGGGGQGTLSASGARVKSGAAALTGSGSLTAVGRHTGIGVAALTGSGSLVVASSTRTRLGAAALTGAGALAASGVRTTTRSATLSGAGSLAASGVRIRSGTVSLSGSGALSASGVRTAFRSATLSGAGALVAVGVRTRSGAATLTGSGAAVVASSIRDARSAAHLSGQGVLTATPLVTGNITGAAALSGSGSLTATGTRIKLGAAVLTGAGSLSATGRRTKLGAAALVGSGSLVAAGTRTRLGSVSTSGTGTLAASGRKTATGSATLSGHGVLVAVAIGGVGSAALTGSGSLVASGQYRKVGQAVLQGAGSLSASGRRTIVAQAVLHGSGALAASGSLTRPASVALSGHGTLAAAGGKIQTGSAVLFGHGTVVAGAHRVVSGRAILIGGGGLFVLNTDSLGAIVPPGTIVLGDQGFMTELGTPGGVRGHVGDPRMTPLGTPGNAGGKKKQTGRLVRLS